MDQVFAALGRKQIQLEAQDAAYTALLDVLAGVVSGHIDRSRLLVNVTERSWTLAAPGQRPAGVAAINGLPVIVTAPEAEGPK